MLDEREVCSYAMIPSCRMLLSEDVDTHVNVLGCRGGEETNLFQFLLSSIKIQNLKINCLI